MEPSQKVRNGAMDDRVPGELVVQKDVGVHE